MLGMQRAAGWTREVGGGKGRETEVQYDKGYKLTDLETPDLK
jgi:hypothetical protein